MLFDLLTKIPDGALKSPLRQTYGGANANNLTWQVHERVHARTYEVYTGRKTLAINNFELVCKGKEGEVCIAHIRLCDPVLVHKPDTKDKSAVVCEELVREHAVEETWS